MRPSTVSVIVPVYDAQEYLERCVRSIREQTWKDLEIILVDDGARDKSPEMCDAYAREDSRIRVLHKKNGGLVSAWMAGVELSTGAWLCFVDSDDWVDLCMVEEMMREASGVSGEIICCNHVIERASGRSEERHALAPGVYEGERLECQVKPQLLGNEKRTVSFSRCMKLFSRELITENMKYCNPGIRMGEDMNIVLPALYDCTRLVILKDALYYHYFFNTASMVHRYDPKLYEGIRELVRTLRTLLTEKGITGWGEPLERETLYLAMLAVKNELRGAQPGYAGRTARICEDAAVGTGSAGHGLQTEERVSRILWWVMKKPSSFRCLVGRSMFGLYDRLRR